MATEPGVSGVAASATRPSAVEKSAELEEEQDVCAWAGRAEALRLSLAEALPNVRAGVCAAPGRSGRWIEAGGTWWLLLVSLALLLQRQDVPAFEIVGGGGHGELEVDFGQADDLGVARTVVLGKTSDVAFDVGAEGKIGLGRRGGEIVDSEFCNTFLRGG